MKIIGTEDMFFFEGFKPLTDIISFRGIKPVQRFDGLLEVDIDSNHPKVTTDLVVGWVAAGGEVEEFPCFIRMTNTAYGKNVTAGIPDRTYLDEDENEVVRKWSEWHDATHEHNSFDDYNFVPSNSFGVDLKGSELALLYNLAGVTLLTASLYKSILPVEEA